MRSINETNTAIRAALKLRYAMPESVLFFEVQSGTGGRATRRADAVSVGCWPSRGMYIDGFEIKVSQHDWRRERLAPQKAEEIARYCDHWWLVTGEEVAEAEEIPDRWGWMELEGDRLKVRKEAPLLEPVALDRAFVASLLRTAGYVDQGLVQKAIDEARKRDSERFENEVQQRVTRLTEQAVRAEKVFGPLFALLDSTETMFTADEELASVVRAVIKSGVANTWSGLRHLQKQLQEAADKVGEAADLHGIPQPAPERRARRRHA